MCIYILAGGTEGVRNKETVYVRCGLISGRREPREGFHIGKAHTK